MVDWRTWVYDKLVSETAVTTLVPAPRIFSTLSVDDTPDVKPFIVIRMGTDRDELAQEDEGHSAGSHECAIWVHDDPIGYTGIDAVIEAIKDSMRDVDGQDVIAARWNGDSGDLADDLRGTVVRTTNFRLDGRR
jgi:hypothetical protein